MRIALVLDRFDPRRGGLERWASEFTTWLIAHGHGVRVVAAECDPAMLPSGASLSPIPAARDAIERAERAAELLRTLAVDVVHDLGTTWACDVFHPLFGSRIADRRATFETLPLVDRVRQLLAPRQRRRWREKRVLEDRQCAECRVLIAPSAMVREHFVDLHGLDRDRIEVVHNGVDVTHFTVSDRDVRRAAARRRLDLDGEVVFLLSAHNLRLKGAATAIRALARLPHTSSAPILLILGRADPGEHTGMAARLGVGDRVRFLGFADDPRDLYAAADVYVHPAFYDPCSLTVLEAWASGIPAITTRRNGAAELMTDGVHGFAVDDPRDDAGVAEAMRRLLDPTERRRMGAEARALAERNAGARQFERIVAVYDAVAARRSR